MADLLPPHDLRELRDAFGTFPTGVTVVTTVAADGEPIGFTANSFASVSLNPPMLLVCPARTLTCFPVFESCARFTVNVLAEGQEAISNVFASFQGDRFAEVSWRPDADGLPLIDGAVTQFCCRTAQVVPAGDHIILIGEVTAFANSGGRGLGYAAGRYFSLGLERAAAETTFKGRRAFAGAIVVASDSILMVEADAGLTVPKMAVDPNASVRSGLTAWFAEAGIDISLGRTYSIFDGARGEHFTYFLASADEARDCTMGHFVSIADVPGEAIASSAERAMLERFVAETQTQSFGFYIGDSVTGYIHTMSDNT